MSIILLKPCINVYCYSASELRYYYYEVLCMSIKEKRHRFRVK